MAATKPKITIEGLQKELRKRFKKPPAPLPDFKFRHMPYTGQRGKTKTLPFQLPEKPDPNMRNPYIDDLEPKFKLTGASKMPREKKEDLRYKQPAWLTKILDQPGNAKAKSTFRDSLKTWIQGIKKKAEGTTSMKPRKPLFTGRVNQDKQLDKLER